MKSPEVRRDARMLVDIDGVRLREPGTTGTTVGVYDLSRSGFRTEWPYKLSVGDRVWLTLPGLRSLEATVRWTKGFTIGCQFANPLHPSVLDHLMRTRSHKQHNLG